MRWVHVRNEEVGGFAAGADALLTGELTACAGSCGPGSLHFINGLYESHRNRAPVVLIAGQIVRDELGFEFPQEVDFRSVYAGCSVFCDEIRTPNQARRKTAMAAQAALSRRGVTLLIVPADVSQSKAPDEPVFAIHRSQTVSRPANPEIASIARAINEGRGSKQANTHSLVVGRFCLAAHGLANGRPGAHIRGMEKYRSRMLEVTVTNHPPQWEWEVSSNGEMIANGFEREQTAAKFEGYNTMFLLLAAGWNP
jgi:thiamine pyrophosphate-dependent acetolactate synthase large subunit-like protein